MDSPRMLLVLLAVVAIMAPSSAAPPEFIQLPLDAGDMYDRPVIGIVTHPGTGTHEIHPVEGEGSYIAASYVKFVESAGARAIPLIYDESWENIEKRLSLVNGVLFTGGSCKHGLYKKRINSIFQHVKYRKDRLGDPIPLLAVCLGFQLLSMNISEDNHILTRFNAVNQPSTLQFPDPSLTNGSVFESFGPKLIHAASTRRLVMQNHIYGISPDSWKNHSKLTKFFDMLTTSVNKTGQEYVSTVQAKQYPIVGTQWHPEKAIFEWGQGLPLFKKDKAPHSEDAVRVTQHFANYFVSQARKSTNKPCEDEVRKNLVDNYRAVFGESKSFDKVYIFFEYADE